VLATTSLAYYSGDDPVNLPWLAVGASGFVSVTGHVVADRLRVMIDAFDAGELDRARAVNASMLPVLRAMGRVGGAIFVKTALRLRGLDVGNTRLPLPPPSEQQVRDIAADLRAAGVTLGPDAYRSAAATPAARPALDAEAAYR
jgi:4-hydroxy-tetrahydrodipicolinate synthase